MGRPSLSLCMIVRDEVHNLPLSLAPVAALFDEVVVVDTGSRDDTPRLAASLGARVISITWPDDFAAARNVSIDQARGDWILWFDADNHIRPEAVEQIRTHLDHERQSILWCTEVVIPEGERLIQKRVFPNRSEVRFQGRVHEQLVHPPGYRSIMTPVEIGHWGYADKVEAGRKGLRNLRLLEEMIQDQPGDMYLCYQLGRTLLNLRRFDEALPALDRATGMVDGETQNPGVFRHAHILKARVLERLNRHDEARDVILTLLRKAPRYGPGFFALGKMDHAGGRYKEAAGALKQFLELGARDPVAGLNEAQMLFTAAMLLGKCRHRLGQTEEAREAYKLAIQVNPRHPEPLLALAAQASDLGQSHAALDYLARCLAISPDNQRALRLRDRLTGSGMIQYA